MILQSSDLGLCLSSWHKPTCRPLTVYDATARLFDDKLANTPAFGYNGSKGGMDWKHKVHSYFISNVPALLGLLAWAQKWQCGAITDDLLCGPRLAPPLTRRGLATSTRPCGAS